jgi:hypothetical protein
MKIATLFTIVASTTWAASTPVLVQELRIPVKDVIANNVSAFDGHSVLPKFQAWHGRNKNQFGFLNGTSQVPSTIKSIVCTSDSENCLLESVIELSPEEMSKLSAAGDKLSKRANANGQVSSTHWKTYFESDGGPGDEHYTDWNLRCGTLSYMSTSFILGTKVISVYGANDIATKVHVTNGRNYHEAVVLQQNFACGWFGNQCCISYYDVQNEKQGTLNRWTWECNSGSSASACQG